MFSDKLRHELLDKEIEKDLEEKTKFESAIWKRISAVERTFKNISFKYSTFEACYFKNCKFINCDFTGAVFTSVNFRSSHFEMCTFDYCRFSSCISTKSIEDNMPTRENVAMELAQSLRVNYAQIGDAEGVNRAIKMELWNTELHLFKAAYPLNAYYKNKFRGWERCNAVIKYYWFLVLNRMWGHGESIPIMVRSVAIVLALIFLYLFFGCQVSCYEAPLQAFEFFLGVGPNLVNHLTLALISAFARYVLLGLFVSVLVRRLTRR